MLARISRMEDKSSLSRFWLPGAFGSLAATPTVPGWAYTTCGCVGPRDHLHVSEPGDFKERTIGIGRSSPSRHWRRRETRRRNHAPKPMAQAPVPN